MLSRVQLFVIPWTVAHQAPLSMKFSWQRYWSGLPYTASLAHWLLNSCLLPCDLKLAFWPPAGPLLSVPSDSALGTPPSPPLHPVLRNLLRPHQPDLGAVAMDPRESRKTGKRNVLISVDQLLLFSWAQHKVAPQKIGLLLEGEGGEWILGTQRVRWP